MLNYHDYHEIFFRWLNFLILCMILRFLFYKYLYPAIKQLIQKEKDTQTQLRSFIQTNHESVAQETRILQQQKEYCTHLTRSVTHWNSAVQEQVLEHTKLRRQFQENYLRHQQEQYKNFTLVKNYQMLLPEITTTLERELTEYFHDTQHQEEYLQKIITHLKSKASP